VEDDTMTPITSSKGSVYTEQERRKRFWQRMCNAYVKHITQLSEPTISKYMGHQELTRRRRYKTLKNKCTCEQLTILLSSAAEER